MFVLLFTGYGFVDFDSLASAQKAVQALQQQGIEAQMAKVIYVCPSISLFCTL